MDRRGFIKLAGAAALGGAAAFRPESAPAAPPSARALARAEKTTSICPYCAVGCGVLVYTDPSKGRVLHIEGDPDHPINQGALCPKGAGLYQMTVNPRRVRKVLYRAPYAEDWQVKDWDWALDRIAAKVKEVRDQSFVTRNARGQTVNRTTAMAHVGSAALDNEECWTLQAIMRTLGLAYIEHQARI